MAAPTTCSFCHRRLDEVSNLVRADRAFICLACARRCVLICEAENAAPVARFPQPVATPQPEPDSRHLQAFLHYGRSGGMGGTPDPVLPWLREFLDAYEIAVLDAVRDPEGQGRDKPDHARTAQGFIAMLRRIARFGTAIERKDCARIAAILAETKWEGSPKRSVILEFHHVAAFIAKAHEMERPSLALGTALQWETLLRQRDVIGEWEPCETGVEPPEGWTINGRLWVNGLLWEHIAPDWTTTKRTTKTGAVVTFDLTALPLALAELQRVKLGERKGAVIIDEAAGRPYAENRFQQEWRKVAASRAGCGTWMQGRAARRKLTKRARRAPTFSAAWSTATRRRRRA